METTAAFLLTSHSPASALGGFEKAFPRKDYLFTWQKYSRGPIQHHCFIVDRPVAFCDLKWFNINRL